MTKQDSTPQSHNKPCTLCHTPRPVLVRCQIDETAKWHMICPGKCWKSVSGGSIDAKSHKDQFPHYRYGGMWKNRHEDGPLNAKKPKSKKKGGKKRVVDEDGGSVGERVGSDGEGEGEGEGERRESQEEGVKVL